MPSRSALTTSITKLPALRLRKGLIMRFTPVSEEDAAGCYPKGEYDALVANATEKTSKTGNPMIEVDLTVYGPNGQENNVRDWLVGTDGGQYKIQRFCKSADLWETYQAGELCADSCKELRVTVKLGIEEGDGQYPPRNKVMDYMPRKLSSAPSAGQPVAKPEPRKELPGVDPVQRRAAVGAAAPGDDIPF
jgi:uncharacterized protein DUF669